MFYDRFGSGLVNTFDRGYAFGLSYFLTNPPGTTTVDSAPRVTGINTVPSLGVCTLTGGFPAAPPSGGRSAELLRFSQGLGAETIIGGVDVLVQDDAADALANGGAAGFARLHYVDFLGAQDFSQTMRLRALAAAVQSFEGNEPASCTCAHGRHHNIGAGTLLRGGEFPDL